MTAEAQGTLKSVQKTIEKINKVFIIFALTMMVLLVTVNVFMRYVLDTGFQWTEDIVTLLFSYLIFFSIPLAFRSNSHIRILYFIEKLPDKARKAFLLLVDLIILVSFVLIFFMSINAIKNIGSSPYGALKYPMSFFYFAVAISCLLVLFDYAIIVYFNLKGLREKDR